MSYTFLKEKTFGEDLATPILAISNKIETLNLSDTYDRYGQEVGHYNAGDYHFDNSDSDAIRDCNTALVNAGLLNNSDEISWVYDSPTAFVDDVYGENEGCDKDAITEFAEQWREDNEYLTKVSGFNYWDGHNWKTVVTSCDFNEPSHDVMEIDGMNEELETMSFVEKGNGKDIYETENYWVVESFFSDHFEKYELYPKSEFKLAEII